MKKLKKLVAITLFVSFLLGSTVSAAPATTAPEQIPQKNENIPIKKVEENQFATNSYSQFAIAPIPAVNVYSITVSPLFYAEDGGLYYGISSYTVYQPPVNAFAQGLAMQITKSQRESLDRAVSNAGYVTVGYYYTTEIRFDGSLTNKRVEFVDPAEFGSLYLGSDNVLYVSMLSTLNNPDMYLAGNFYYFAYGKQQSRIFSAVARFVD